MTKLFIAFEGTDGAGKTTLRRWLYRTLGSMGLDVLAIRQNGWLDPTHTRVITNARFFGWRYPSDEITAAYVGDKELFTERLIEPHLAERHVLADRFVVSDIVYHAAIFGIPPETTYAAYRDSRTRAPDLTIFVDAPVAAAADRLARRSAEQRKPWDTPDVQRSIYEMFQRVLFTDEFDVGEVVRVRNEGSVVDAFEELERSVVPRVVRAESSPAS